MNNWRGITMRLLSSSVAWSWAFNVVRLASGVLLIPLLLHCLTKTEMGMYYVFLSLNALGPLMDFGFLNAIDRNVGYAMAGVTELKAHGAVRSEANSSGPNYPLLWRLLHTTRALYRVFAMVLFVVLLVWGTYVVSLGAAQTPQPQLTWLAFGIGLAATTLELYSVWWSVFLRGMNQVLAGTRILVSVYLVRIVLSCALLLAGGGLLSIPISGLLTSLLMRYLARRSCLGFLSAHPSPTPTRAEILALLRILWPNSWRLGVQLFSNYLATNMNTFICLHVFEDPLEVSARYGLSMQILNILVTMAGVWVSVKWPIISQFRARHDLSSLRKVFWPRLWLFKISYILMALMAVWVAPFLLGWLGTNKTMLPSPWLGLAACYIFLEGQLTVWATLIITENRLPFLWPFVGANVLCPYLVLLLLITTDLGVGALVVGPLIAGSLLNYWYWPMEGARSLESRWWRFLLTRPA